MSSSHSKFGTPAVFFTAIATILGAILFLRFGFAVGMLGFWGVVFIIILGHLVTIPTAFALSEIATNKRVEGGGEYFIISRSFGLNIGSTIGITLYLSQAISVAFYVIAFTEAFEFFFNFMHNKYGIYLPRQVISLPVMGMLSFIIIKKGANLGVKALYIVVGILFIAIVMFFLGKPTSEGGSMSTLLNFNYRNMNNFFVVFAIVFPAFTGMTAGVGLSGDLKNPGRAIPIGTVSATVIGMIVYFFVAYKLAISANADELLKHQFVMSKIALAGYIIIPIGLAASTLSSALGSVMVAPRTLYALARDVSFPKKKMNRFLGKERIKDSEPVNASIVTCLIAFIFVAIGDINAVAEIISMFFMLTYGSVCLISFLNHFGASPSYRPSFKSKWWISLIGFVTSVWVMFKINTPYAFGSFVVLILLYIYINTYHKKRKGLAVLFVNSIFQLNRRLHLYLQRNKKSKLFTDWRPSVICISKNSFERDNALRFLDWISHKYGFATYLHKVEGLFSKETAAIAKKECDALIKKVDHNSSVFIDTIISPSYTSAVAQAIQIPGISGFANNIVMFEFAKNEKSDIDNIIKNFFLVRSGEFDVLLLAASKSYPRFQNGIHVWINIHDEKNVNLMILLSFIILNHPVWNKANIKVFVLTKEDDSKDAQKAIKDLIKTGRIPIYPENIEFINQGKDMDFKELINKNSKDAGFVILGFREEDLNKEKASFFEGYEDLGDILFVFSNTRIPIE